MSRVVGHLCAVRHCPYLAESSIEDFVVCSLHDSPLTRVMLEVGKAPGSFWMDERPIILPVGDLEERDFSERIAEGIYAHDDERMIDVAPGPVRMIHASYDLAAHWE